MPTFAYSAKDSQKRVIQGVLDAGSEGEAVEKLGQMGCFPISLRRQDAAPLSSGSSPPLGGEGGVRGAPAAVTAPAGRTTKVRRRDLCIFLRQLADLLDAGVTLVGALQVIGDQTEQAALRSVVVGLLFAIREGQSFSDALAAYPKAFSSLVVSMVRSGEVGGLLPEVLNRLADFSEAEEELSSKVRSALAYPGIILVVGIATIAILLTIVVPKLTALFEEVGQVLPLPTRILIGLSHWLVTFWWVPVAVIAFGAVVLTRVMRSTEGRFALDRLTLRLPLWGALIRKVETARFARSLGMLLGHGVAILQAVAVVAQATQNQVLKRALLGIGERLEGGTGLSHGMRECQIFAPFVIQMVAVGEEGGTLDRSLLKVAEAYERESDRTMKVVTSLIEPVMILMMGLVVGFIVVSMMLPIFQIDIRSR